MGLNDVVLNYLEPGLTAGLMAGALLGIAETLGLVWSTGQKKNLSAAPYAAIAYGLLGLVGGLGLGLVGALLAAMFSFRANPATTYAVCGALIFAGLTVVVGRYRLNRDLFHEHLRTSSRQGLLFHAGLLVSGIVLFILIGLTGYWAAQWIPAITRWWGGLASFVVALTVAGGLALVSRPKPAKTATSIPSTLRDRPNVILIGLDALRADRMGCYGYGEEISPRMDALAADGVRYAQTTTQSSWTKPSFASILTSLYPSTHRAIYKSDRLPKSVTTLAQVMSAAGYRTGGLANNINIASHFGFDQGFDEYRFLAPDYEFGASASSSQLAIYQIARRVRAMLGGKRVRCQDFYQDAAVVNREAMAWLKANRESRFFLFLHYMEPHDPYFEHPYNGRGYARASNQNPDPALAPTFSALYDGEIRYLDECLGQFFDWLRTEGLYDALIVLTSDHGEEFQDHGGWWHGKTLYEEQIWVPLIVKYPGNARAGTVVTDLVSSLDVAPTILDTAGLSIPETMMGRSLWSPSDPPRFVFAEEDHEGNVLRSLQTSTHKLILANPDNPRGLPTTALFNLQKDPGEQNNVAEQFPGTVSEMTGWLNQVEAVAQGKAVQSEAVDIDPEVEERLRSLGYIE